MPAPATPEPPPFFAPDPLLHDLLAVSLTAINLLRPCYGPTGELDDFTPEYFNAAAQRMTGLPERPVGTARTLFPDIFTNGIFAFYRQVFETGAPDHFERYYQADGLDNYFQIAARRSGERLLVSFTDTADQTRTAAENALRESRAAEQAARAEAEAQQALLYSVFEQAPAMICILQGPQHVFEFANQGYRALLGNRPLVGRTFAEALPELVGQGIMEPLDQVYRTGESFYASEQLARLDHTNTSPAELEQRYYNLVWQARRDGAGAIDGVLVFAYDVTPQVLARQQVEHLHQLAEAARDEAEAGRQRLTQMLLRMPANIALLRGPKHVYDIVNSEYERLFPGRTLLGRPLREAVPELAGQGFYELFDQVYETGEPFYQAEAEAWADYAGTGKPQRRYYRTAFEPIRDAQGQVTEVLNFAVDVTAQVEARQQVEQLNQQLEAARAAAERERGQLQSLLTQAPVAIALLQGEDLHVATVNSEMAAIWGQPLDHIRDRPLLEGVPELRGQGFDELLRQVMATQVPVVGTEAPAVLRRNGQLQTSYYNFVYQPLYDAEGQVAGVIDVAVEVTEQVLARRQVEQLNAELEARVQQRTQAAEQAQAETEAQRQRLRQLIAEAPALIAVLRGPEHRVELANDGFQAIFGGRELVGKTYREAIPEFASQSFFDLLDAVYRTGETYHGIDEPVTLDRTNSGRLEQTYITFIYQATRDFQGQIDGIMVFCYEVTDQVQARQQVQDLNEELAASNAELHQSNTQLTRTNVDLDTFVYTASHDLKAPITNIESIVLALRDTLPPEVQQDDVVAHLLELLDTTVTRFQFTIGQLTDISRLQLAHAGPAEPVQLAAVLESVRLDLAPALAAAGTQLTVEVAAGLVVSFSPANLRSIVYNLLSNAIKYRAPDRPALVQVRAAPTDLGVVLEVQDNGLGMSEVQQRQLFGLFQRLHTHVEGTGVGLYITKRLVENGGGTIAVQSQPQVGTTFTVTFPA